MIIFHFVHIYGQSENIISRQTADSLLSLAQKEFSSNIHLAEKYVHEALTIYEDIEDLNQTILCYNALTNISYNNSDIVKAAEYSKKALNLAETSNTVNDITIIFSKNNYSSVLKDIGNYAGAIYILEKLLVEHTIDTSMLLKIHTNLSTYYNHINDYESGELHFEKANSYKSQKTNEVYPFRTYEPKIIRLYESGDYNECLQLINEVVLKEEIKKSSKIVALRWSAKARSKLKDFKGAINSINSSFEFIEENDLYEKTRCLIAWGEILEKKGDYSSAKKKYLLAQSSISRDSLQSNPPIISIILNKLARIESELGNNNLSLKYINQALNVLEFDLDGKIDTLILRKVLYRENLFLKANFLQKLKKNPKDIIRFYDRSITMVIESRKDINSIASKINDGINSKKIFEEAIDFVYQQYTKTSEKKYLWQALLWSDLSKSMTLFEAKTQHDLVKSYDQDSISFEYVNEYAKLQSLILKANKQRLKSQQDSSYLKLIDHILNIQNRIKELTKKNEELKNLTIKELSKKLKNSNCVEIFAGDDNYYFFTHVNGHLEVSQVNRSTVEHICQDITAKISSPNNQQTEQDSFEYKLELVSNWLNLESLGDAGFNTIHVISDGSFFNIPLEIIPCGKSNLLNQGTVTYSYSLKSINNQEVSHDYQSALGFAPSFTNNENSSYQELMCNQEELLEIEKSISLKSFINDNATLGNLVDNLGRADLIHFATHAVIDKNHHLGNHIVLAKDQLSIADLYKYEWNNKSVVLSACSTGQGTQVAGEGVFSMARTLIELGCKEVLVSLWPIDDCASKDLMALMYTHLYKEKTLAKALKKAKNEYINTSQDHLRDPYYWSSFVVFNAEFDSGYAKFSHNAIWAIALLFFVLICGTFLRSKKSSIHS